MTPFEKEVNQIVDRKIVEIQASLESFLGEELKKFRVSINTECTYVDKSRHHCHKLATDGAYCHTHYLKYVGSQSANDDQR